MFDAAWQTAVHSHAVQNTPHVIAALAAAVTAPGAAPFVAVAPALLGVVPRAAFGLTDAPAAAPPGPAQAAPVAAAAPQSQTALASAAAPAAAPPGLVQGPHCLPPGAAAVAGIVDAPAQPPPPPQGPPPPWAPKPPPAPLLMPVPPQSQEQEQEAEEQEASAEPEVPTLTSLSQQMTAITDHLQTMQRQLELLTSMAMQTHTTTVATACMAASEAYSAANSRQSSGADFERIDAAAEDEEGPSSGAAAAAEDEGEPSSGAAAAAPPRDRADGSSVQR